MHNSSDIKLSLLVILLNFYYHTQKIIYTHIQHYTDGISSYFLSLHRVVETNPPSCLLTLGKCHSLISKTKEPGLFTVPAFLV